MASARIIIHGSSAAWSYKLNVHIRQAHGVGCRGSRGRRRGGEFSMHTEAQRQRRRLQDSGVLLVWGGRVVGRHASCVGRLISCHSHLS